MNEEPDARNDTLDTGMNFKHAESAPSHDVEIPSYMAMVLNILQRFSLNGM